MDYPTQPVDIVLKPGQKFQLGTLVATAGALAALEKAGHTPYPFLVRHQMGQYGNVSLEDKRQNDEAIDSGRRITSKYNLETHAVIWVTTEPDRSKTTVILPEEYMP